MSEPSDVSGTPSGAPDGPFRDWSALHGDAAPTGLVGAWLRCVYVPARALVRLGVSPNQITLTGLLIGAAALVPAAAGSRWPLLAAALVGVSALLDGLDGAVAVLASRVTRGGARLDHLCDRITELCFAASLWLAGAPVVWCAAGGALGLAHELLRSAARRRGRTGIGVITVSERPTRVLVAAMFLLAAGVYPGSAGAWTTTGAIVMTVAGAVGLAQLLVVARSE